MFKQGDRIKGQGGRMLTIIQPIMFADNPEYFVEFDDKPGDLVQVAIKDTRPPDKQWHPNKEKGKPPEKTGPDLTALGGPDYSSMPQARWDELRQIIERRQESARSVAQLLAEAVYWKVKSNSADPEAVLKELSWSTEADKVIDAPTKQAVLGRVKARLEAEHETATKA